METVNDYIETDLGNVAPNPRGEYNPESVYEYLDLVDYKGGSYLCIADTATGIAPAQGKDSSTWQLLTLPGNLTPEYIAMHDDVINKAASAAEDAVQAAADRAEVENMKENVSHLQAETIEAASQASADKESTAGYAAAAEASRKATAKSEANVDTQVSGFDQHVQDQIATVTEDITATRRQAVDAVTAQQKKSVQDVKDQTAEYIEAKTTEAQNTITSHTKAKITETDAALQKTQAAANKTIKDANTAKDNLAKAVQDATDLKTDIGATIADAKTATKNANTAAQTATTAAASAKTTAESAASEAITQATAAQTAAEAVMEQVNHLAFSINPDDGGLDITYMYEEAE